MQWDVFLVFFMLLIDKQQSWHRIDYYAILLKGKIQKAIEFSFVNAIGGAFKIAHNNVANIVTIDYAFCNNPVRCRI